MFVPMNATTPTVPSWRLCRKLLLLTLLWLTFVGIETSNVAAQAVTPLANPDLAPACGLDVALVLDASSSIDNESEDPATIPSDQDQVRAATKDFVNSFADTGSQIAIIEFASIADTPIPYSLVNQNTLTNTFEPYIEQSGSGDGYHDGRLGECTNWDDGFRQINALPSKPDLVVFMTDGQPNTINGGTACDATIPVALDAAATQANITKSGDDGAHIFVVGIGNKVVQSNLRNITENPNQIYNTVNLDTADFTLSTFDNLYDDFQDIAFGLCAPSISINKVVDELDGNGDVPHPDQSFIGELTVQSGTYSWSSPGTPSGENHLGTTDINGNLTFQWDRSDLSSSSTITITELVEDGYSFVDASCSVKTLGNPTAQNLPIQLGDAAFTAIVETGDLVTCNVRNARHQIEVAKSVEPETLPEPGGTVTYTYQITNQGATEVTLDSLIDDKLLDLNGQGSCATHSQLAPVVISSGQSYSCRVSADIVANANTVYTNTVTATASNSSGSQASASAEAAVTIMDVQPSAVIDKRVDLASQPESSALFTFTLTITNTSRAESLTLNSLTDSPFGDVTIVSDTIVGTDCSTPQILAPWGEAGAAYSCRIAAKVTGNPGNYADLASAVLSDDDGNEITVSDGAVVSLTDVPPSASLQIVPNPVARPEPGGLFALTVSITNTNAAEAITVDSLTDSLYGNITAASSSIVSTTCQANQILSPAGLAGDTYSCIVSVAHSGGPATFENTLTVQISDDDGNQIPVSASSQVEIVDLPAALEVVHRPNQSTILEPGEDVTFTLSIKNISSVDTITIMDISELIQGSEEGEITALCSLSLPHVLAPGESLTCSYSRFVAGNAGELPTSVLTVTAIDDDGNPLEESQQESIDVLDLPSAIQVTKLADVSEVMEPGENVTYTVTVENSSVGDSVIIEELIDDRFGDISASCDLPLPATLAPGEKLICPFTRFVEGMVGTVHVNRVTARGVDDDGNPLTDSDQEEIAIDDIPSSIKVIETASPSGVLEPGADVTFTAIVRNTSIADRVLVTQVVRLVDDSTIDISENCFLAPPVVLAPGEEINCQFSEFVSGTGGDTYVNQIQAFGQDDDGNTVVDFDQENVDVLDVSSSIRLIKEAIKTSVPEPSGTITFALSVKNTSLVDSVTVTEITHSEPIVSQRGGNPASNGCDALLPITLAPDERFDCESTELISGSVGAIILSESTVLATDDDGNSLTSTDQSAVEIIDVPSDLRIDLTASEAGLAEPGGSVIFTARIENSSALDSITLQSVTSTQGDDISTSCEPALSTALAPGEQIECTYTLTFFGDQSDTFTDTVTAVALDDDGVTIREEDSAQVHIVNQLPTISVRKVVSPTSVPETGGDVTFTFEVINNSRSETVDLQNMQDASLGDLNGQGNCTVPQFLTADGGRYECSVTLFVQGDFGNNDRAEVRATAVDNDGSEDTGFDIQEIFFTDVLPDIAVTTAISPSVIVESGQDVSQALIVTNNSAEEVIITALTDSNAMSLNGEGSCSLPQTIPGHGTYTCSFTRFITGTFGSPQTNIVVATGNDDEENMARAANSTTLRFIKLAPVITVIKTDALLIDTFNEESQQGQVSPGDTLAYTITVSNLGDETASGIQLLDTPDVATALVIGSVQTSKGTVLTGNVDGDALVLIDIGTLAPGESMVVTFNVLVDPATDVTLIGNQASVSFTSDDSPDGTSIVESDDPATDDVDDETKTTVTFAPQSLDIIDEPTTTPTFSDYIFLPMVTR